ncbi:putative ATP-dependent helicase C23E6.02 like protein [Verticillium longisporum]|uniref:Putative ATP-dependent helicase C23E6.02 like protein n=1 Tax=Verticillium longisporum TaxID=100787 RepID=A0A8I3AUG3_VERLO|nr:putative ATP-dependent helicase C23E6.02 like protein [Verticillium longisporum]KAG7138276.1 putative ATP-dependent helicase C23E6.02 like protein [Verticillium longisporum]
MADSQAYQGDAALTNAEYHIRQLRDSLKGERAYLRKLPRDGHDTFLAAQIHTTRRKIASLCEQIDAAEESKGRIVTRFPDARITADRPNDSFSRFYGHRTYPSAYHEGNAPVQVGTGYETASPESHRAIRPNGLYSHQTRQPGFPSYISGDMASSSHGSGYGQSDFRPRSKRDLSSVQGAHDAMSPGRSKRQAFVDSRRSSTASDSSVMDLTQADDKIEAAVAQKRSKTETRRQGVTYPMTSSPIFLEERLVRPEPSRSSSPVPASLFGHQPSWRAPNDGANNIMRRDGSQRQQPALTGLAATIQRTSQIDFNTMTYGSGDALEENTQRDLHRILEIDSPGSASQRQANIGEEERQRQHIEQFVRTLGAETPDDQQVDVPPGLRYPLYAHQKQALTWMKKQEASARKGGILGDDMGLGKTISTLALMIANPAKNGSRTTLIVAPLSLVRQWEEEIKDKLLPDHQLSICIFHESNRPRADELMRYDVVLTTYQTLCSEHKKVTTFWTQAADRNVDQDNDVLLAQSVRLFHPTKSMFYRIVLDEAQMIKNRKGKTSLAATALMAKHRWCLTGTPMMNTLHEIYPFYRFLQIEPYNDWAIFTRTFGPLKKGANPGPALNAFRVLLQKTMLRRDKKSEINGQRILQLPEKTEEIVHIELEGEQLQYYKAVTENAQVIFNAYIREGTSHKQYSVLLVQLLRMRQAVCHPHLVLDDEESVSLNRDKEAALELAMTLKAPVVNRLIEQVRGAMESLEGFDCPVCLDKIPNPAIPFPCGHYMCSDCLRTHFENSERDNIRRGENVQQIRCAVCREPLETEKVIDLSTFKLLHMPELLDAEVNDINKEREESDTSGDEESDEFSSDDEEENADDVDARGNLQGFVVDDEDDESSTVGAPSRHTKAKQQAKSKRATTKNKQPKQKGPRRKVKATMLKSLRKSAKRSAQDGRDYRRYLSKHWMTSAKVQACVDLIKQIRDESDGRAKTLIFSQWTMFLDLMEIALQKDEELKHVGHVRYDGDMNMKDRFKSAQRFRESPRTKLMLISLKAGNAGLNLVQASRVIILDPFWNPFVEMQAVDRVHRIGQQNEVKVYRILIKDSVEDRIMEIQTKKREAIEAALDGKASRGMGLSMADLRHLFGF